MAQDREHVSLETSQTSSADRWPDVKAIFERAITLDASEWSDFLHQNCGNDRDLLRDVQSLLRAHDHSSGFLEEPCLSIKELIPASEAAGEEVSPPGAGTRIGAYLLEREIGCGGMGAVFLANRADDEFQKRVAVKLIRNEKVSDFAVKRFRLERQILARLEHPYIARLIDGGSTEAGMPYFVLEYVEGQVLTQYCDSHNLTVREMLELFLKICAAVTYAHERQIVHRDLKPGNILVRADGAPKLLDFGIAKILEADGPGVSREATAVGMRMLTPAYASPEQMQGDPATACSDIYSLGVVLYEMLCGERPSLHAVQQSVSSKEEKEGHIARNLRAIIFRAIRLDPAERYGSVAVFAEDIGRYLNGLPTRASLPEETLVAPERISIAILPFREVGGDGVANQTLRSMLTDALITRLSKVERLSVRPTSAVLRYSKEQDGVRAARELRVKYVLEGSWQSVSGAVRLNVQLVSVETGQTVWAYSFQEQTSDLLRLEDSLAEQIAAALIPQLTSEERALLASAGTQSEKAHEAYLRGRFYWNRSAGEPEELAKALLCFTQAVDADPRYARAYAGIADYYLRLGLWGGVPPAESFAAGIDAAEKALALDPQLAEAHASLGFCLWAYNRDDSRAEREFQLAIARSPDNASAHHWFGLLNSARNRPELALANLDRARKVDPSSPVIAAALGFVHHNSRDYGRARELLLEAARDLRHSAVLQEMLAWSYLQSGELDKALTHAERAVKAGDESPASLAVMARVLSASGDRPGAAKICKQLDALTDRRYVSGYDTASALLAMGDVQNALAQLERAFADHDWWVCWIGVDPRWDSVRSEPRFGRLLNRVNIGSREATAAEFIGRPVRRNRKNVAVLAGLCAVALGAILLPWLRPHSSGNLPFSNPSFAKLTGDGTAQLAAISPDGGSIVYTTSIKGQTHLWRRPAAAPGAAVQIAQMTGDITALNFTRAGRQVAFQNYPALQPARRQMYTLPISGGAPERVFGELPGPARLSSDGLLAAIVRPNLSAGHDEIAIADLRLGTERTVATDPYPNHISLIAAPAWSHDSRFLAYPLEQRDAKGFFIGLNILNRQKNKTSRIQYPRFLSLQHLEWTATGTGLLVVGREQNLSFQQIWYVPFPKGPAVRLGNDVDSFVGASLTADGSKLVSVRRQTLAKIYTLRLNSLRQHVQITPGSGRYFDLSWTSEGRLLYASDSTGSADIWMVDAEGAERQLTAGDGLYWAPVASPDGKLIAYHANRSGSWQIWRANADGSHPVQLTSGAQDSNWPQFSRDGKSLIYHRADPNGLWSLWKTPVEGGLAVQITTRRTMHPAVSPKDGKLAAWLADDAAKGGWVLGVFGPDGGEPLRMFDPGMPITPESQLAWSPDGSGITFLSQRNGVWNLWLQPIDGRAPSALTSFTAGQIYSFSWSKDGRLAFSQGSTTSDVVLVREAGNRK